VLIGKDTHTRRWVNWEIEQAHKQNKDIIGVFARGATDADVPASLKKYGCERVAWNADNIIAALEGTDAPFQDSDGTASPTPAYTARSTCGSRIMDGCGLHVCCRSRCRLRPEPFFMVLYAGDV